MIFEMAGLLTYRFTNRLLSAILGTLKLTFFCLKLGRLLEKQSHGYV